VFFNADNNFKRAIDEILKKKRDTLIQFVKVELKDADQNKCKKTLLDAATRGKTEIVEALHSLGANVKAEGNYGRTAVMFAAGGGHTETVKFLHSLGADVKAADIKR
jgi:ankyrin repeat protein